ncbi:MAG: imidazolonepropionase [Ignavibacteriales bacterium]|nr:imidazolonepropionase [Ignavibacteriales bacterium]
MFTLLKSPSQIISVSTSGKNYKSGRNMNDIGVLENHSIVIENEIIKDIIPNNSNNKHSYDKIIDIKDKIILPGLVECHTHTAFAGSRANEFRQRLQGNSYEEIAKSGGGINTTVQAVRKLSLEELINLTKPRIDYFISQGITTLEIKSGYGLSYYDEIKILQAVNILKKNYLIDIIPTFLGAHTFPREYKNDHKKYIDIIISEQLPFIMKNKLAVFCDAFCEKTAFSPEQVDKIFTRASELGFKLKLHSDQFNSIGGIDIGIKHKVKSIDHLEVITDDDIRKITKTKIVSVLLPGVSFFLDYGFAPARKLIDNGAIVALSTDYNPGSSHIANLNLIMSIAALKMKMTIEETISAVTINAAKALDVNKKVGSIEIGKRADFAIFETKEYADIIYNVGKNLDCMTIKNGQVIYNKE